MRDLTVSVLQFDVKFGDLKSNLDRALKLMKQASGRGTQVMLLPEMWTLGFDYDSMAKLAPSYVEDALSLLRDMAVKYGSYIVSGTLPESENGAFYNTAFLISPKGELAGKYRKVHLFEGMKEKEFFTPGGEAGVLETSFGKIGIAVCFDIRFPELFRQMALDGAEAIFVPAHFPHPRQQHWEVLLRARAIENQLYVIGCNRVGKEGQKEFFGNSMIVGPYGEIVDEAGEGEEVLTETIDLENVQQMRKMLPTISERRPEAYGTPPVPESDVFESPLEKYRKEKAGLRFKNTVQPMKSRRSADKR